MESGNSLRYAALFTKFSICIIHIWLNIGRITYLKFNKFDVKPDSRNKNRIVPARVA